MQSDEYAFIESCVVRDVKSVQFSLTWVFYAYEMTEELLFTIKMMNDNFSFNYVN